MDIDEPSLLNARGEKFVTRLYMAPLSKKRRPLSADSTPAQTSAFSFLSPPTSDDRLENAPPAYQQLWVQPPPRRMRPSSPAGPRGHRPRPISSPTPAHAHSHATFGPPNMTPLSNPSSPTRPPAFYGVPRAPPTVTYAEQHNPFILSTQAHSHEHTPSYMVPLSPIAPSPFSGTLPPVSAPRISNATFQRTIDDIAGRMNVLNAAFACAQLQVRADAAQAQVQVQAQQAQVQAQAQARYRALPMLGQYPASAEVGGAEKEQSTHVHEAPEEDKENVGVEQAPSGRRRPSTATYTMDDSQVLSGLGFGKGNGSGALRKEIGNIAVPPEAVTRTKKDRKSKRKSSLSFPTSQETN
jgi:hypothetical protein